MREQAPDSGTEQVRGTEQMQAREFATAFRGFLDWVHSVAAKQEK